MSASFTCVHKLYSQLNSYYVRLQCRWIVNVYSTDISLHADLYDTWVAVSTFSAKHIRLCNLRQIGVFFTARRSLLASYKLSAWLRSSVRRSVARYNALIATKTVQHVATYSSQVAHRRGEIWCRRLSRWNCVRSVWAEFLTDDPAAWKVRVGEHYMFRKDATQMDISIERILFHPDRNRKDLLTYLLTPTADWLSSVFVNCEDLSVAESERRSSKLLGPFHIGNYFEITFARKFSV